MDNDRSQMPSTGMAMGKGRREGERKRRGRDKQGERERCREGRESKRDYNRRKTFL